MFYRGLLDRIGGFNDTVPLLDDWDFTLRLARAARFAPTGATTVAMTARLDLVAQRLGAALPHYLAVLDALYAAHPADARVAEEARAPPRERRERARRGARLAARAARPRRVHGRARRPRILTGTRDAACVTSGRAAGTLDPGFVRPVPILAEFEAPCPLQLCADPQRCLAHLVPGPPSVRDPAVRGDVVVREIVRARLGKLPR